MSHGIQLIFLLGGGGTKRTGPNWGGALYRRVLEGKGRFNQKGKGKEEGLFRK